jgi:UDP-N-acetylmuramoylalanine--D-glutamate ligase
MMAHKLIILGGGESGVGAALLGRQQGYDVFLSDAGTIKEKYKKELSDNQIEFEEGGHNEEKIFSDDEIVKSPGIPEKNKMIKAIRAKIFLSSVRLNWHIVLKATVK